jgi:hypothetical protein
MVSMSAAAFDLPIRNGPPSSTRANEWQLSRFCVLLRSFRFVSTSSQQSLSFGGELGI